MGTGLRTARGRKGAAQRVRGIGKGFRVLGSRVLGFRVEGFSLG